MIARPSSQVAHAVTRVRLDAPARDEADTLAVEEPLEIRLLWEADGRVNSRSIAVTMRTPGRDFELAAGFLYGEAIIGRREDVVDVSYCIDENSETGEQTFNIVSVTLRPGLAFDATRLERNFYTTSSCGVCGKATLEALELQGCETLAAGPNVAPAVLCRLPVALRASQVVFERTGGLHAAGLFGTDGTLLAMEEDVGRHNALDKLVGARFLEGELPLSEGVLMLSGRASFELVQKALRARIAVVASVGAPSSLAVELAESFGMTLAGFVRPEGFNVYCGGERLAP